MEKVKVAVLGAGNRGMYSYAPYAISHPNEMVVTAIAEPDIEKRKQFQTMYKLPEDMCFDSWERLLEKPKLADAIFVCTQDKMHFDPTITAIEKGYHVLLEKPMSPDMDECMKMTAQAELHDKQLVVCHVLRYTQFFKTIKKCLDSGRIGKLISIQHNENVSYWHQAHSFVRGNWNNSELSCPMILAKSCHDMDILYWLAGAEATHISSFGGLKWFKSENAPKGAPKRCIEGCPDAENCPYYAPHFYLTENVGWPVSVISTDTSMEARIKALKEGPYGKCVYHCDNNVVDHQVVNIEFANDVTAAFTLCAFTGENCRTIKLMGTNGEIRGHMEKNEIEITDFLTGSKEIMHLKNATGHGGGDFGLVHDFVQLLQKLDDKDERKEISTNAAASLHSHLMAFAAEKARVEKKVIDMKHCFKEVL